MEERDKKATRIDEQDHLIGKQQMDTPKKPVDAVTVVGSNVLILAFYTVVFKAIPDQGGLYLDAFLIITQLLFVWQSRTA